MDQLNQQQVMSALQCGVSGQNINYLGAGATSGNSLIGSYTTTSTGNSIGTVYSDTNGTLWNYWQNAYYPYVIRESYPVYIQEKAMDKGKQAYEIIKALMDAKLLDVEKVKDFISAMDILLKTL